MSWRNGFLSAGLAACLCLTQFCGAQTANGSITAGGSVQGQVVDQDHSPVVGASVYAVTGPAGTGMGHAVLTDNDGRFTLPNLAPGDYTLSAFKPQDGFGDPASPLYGNSKVVMPVTVSSATQVSDIEITLGRPGGVLHVEAYDAVSHKPLLHASYVLRQVNNSGAVMQGQRDLPADFLLPPVDTSVELHADGYAPWTLHDSDRAFVTLQPGEHRSVRADLQPVVPVAPPVAASPAVAPPAAK